MLKIELIAEIVHEANAAYCRSIGDNSQPTWAAAPDWQKESAIDGVESILSGDVWSPEDSHDNWLALKEVEGWTYGAVKDTTLKTHPCMLPYNKLPGEQKVKDKIFFALVKALMAVEE